MTLSPSSRRFALVLGFGFVLALSLAPMVAWAREQQFPPAAASAPAPAITETPYEEVHQALIRLPLAALLGALLALRPRRSRRNVLVIQTQIMLAVVGAVIMLVVGQSLARAFGIVGAANLIRYRSTIDDPKDAVVMLCALAAGLAAGVGLYTLAPFATVFMVGMLWLVEYFEPESRKHFELEVCIKDAPLFRPKLEDSLSGFGLKFELLAEKEDELRYSVSAPLDVRTRDVSDTIRLLGGIDDVSIEWDEKKPKN